MARTWPTSFMLLAVASLAGVLIWSCNNDSAQPEPAGGMPSQSQAMSHTMPSAGSGMMQQLRASCPMVVEGADVSASDIEGGVALKFTTDQGDVGDLRARVRQMAQMYEMHQAHGSLMWHQMGRGHMGYGGGTMGTGHMNYGGMGRGGMGQGGMGMGYGMAKGPMPAATAAVTDLDRGARIELKPTDPSQLEDLREHIRWHQQRMQASQCWMPQAGQG